jgi:hypothetical protein
MLALQHFVQTYISMIENVVSCPDNTKLTEISLRNETDAALMQQPLQPHNEGGDQTPDSLTLFPEIMRHTMIMYPGKVALVAQDRSMTFREIETESNPVAELLINNSVSFGHYVDIYGEHTSRMVVGILGIMKARAVYCPLSDDCPIDRIRSIIEEAGIEMVLLQSRNDVSSSQVLLSSMAMGAAVWTGVSAVSLAVGWFPVASAFGGAISTTWTSKLQIFCLNYSEIRFS